MLVYVVILLKLHPKIMFIFSIVLIIMVIVKFMLISWLPIIMDMIPVRCIYYKLILMTFLSYNLVHQVSVWVPVFLMTIVTLQTMIRLP